MHFKFVLVPIHLSLWYLFHYQVLFVKHTKLENVGKHRINDLGDQFKHKLCGHMLVYILDICCSLRVYNTAKKALLPRLRTTGLVV